MKKAFELRKFILAFFVACFLFANTSFAEQSVFDDGVTAYRSGNIEECFNIMTELKKKDPSNAYVVYYLAMANTKLGNFDDAKAEYEEVIFLNQDQELVSYAKEGIQNINNALGDDSASKEASVKKEVAADKPPKQERVKKSSVASSDSKSDVSDEDIAKAIKTLRSAGVLNVNLGVNDSKSKTASGADADMMKQMTEMMNMNMMMGSMGGGKSSGMDMLPFLMMQQSQGGDKSKISPDLIQMMMNNSMLDGLSSFDTKDK